MYTNRKRNRSQSPYPQTTTHPRQNNRSTRQQTPSTITQTSNICHTTYRHRILPQIRHRVTPSSPERKTRQYQGQSLNKPNRNISETQSRASSHHLDSSVILRPPQTECAIQNQYYHHQGGVGIVAVIVVL